MNNLFKKKVKYKTNLSKVITDTYIDSDFKVNKWGQGCTIVKLDGDGKIPTIGMAQDEYTLDPEYLKRRGFNIPKPSCTDITITIPNKSVIKTCCDNPQKYKNIISNNMKFWACSSCGADLGDID